MPLGTCLSNLLGYKDLDPQLVGDSKILIAGVKMEKSQFKRFMGSEDGSSEGMLLQRVNLWLSSTPSYPHINKIQELSLIDLLTNIFNEANKLKASLCQCFFDIISKISLLDVPADKENLLSMSIIEANKCANSISERTELWFDTVKIKLQDVSNIISIDDVACSIGTPAGVAPGSTTASESSGPPPVPPAVPPVPGGRITPLTPGPGTLEWGCSPSALLP